MNKESEPRKAAIVTWCYDNGKTNYGQILQCYAMQTMVRRLGYETKVIRYRERRIDEKESLDEKSEEYVNLYELCYRLEKMEARANVRIFRFVKFIKENICLSRQCYTKEDVERECEDVDILICGSDQIWNPLWFKDIHALNFGRPDQKRIAYAASGVFIESPENELIYRKLGKYLECFDLVTVREKVSIDILKKYTTKQITDVVDPTLLLSQDDWNQVAARRTMEEPYIFCYCLGKIRGHKILLKRIMKKYGVRKILCIAPEGQRHDGEVEDEGYFQYIRDAGPGEFLALIRDAKAVCTDSFHGVAMSIVYQKQFYIFRRAMQEIRYRANMERQDNLLEKLGIVEKRAILCINDIEASREVVYERIQIKRNQENIKNILEKFL